MECRWIGISEKRSLSLDIQGFASDISGKAEFGVTVVAAAERYAIINAVRVHSIESQQGNRTDANANLIGQYHVR